MDLILWRHAEAEELREGQTDHERKLTDKGRRQATRMSLWLREHLPETPRILVSPAKRTQETAAHLGLRFTTEPNLAMGQTVADALLAVGDLQAKGCCVLVGHQPMLGQIVSGLMQSQVDDWPVKKGGLWWFSTRQREGETESRWVLQTVINPKDLGGK